MLNPEFRRYLWTELSPHRLIAMPVVLGALFALAGLTEFGVKTAAYYCFALVVYLWGTRRAAAAVAEEVQGGTWDSQRMSALNAWPMAWGKLFGSTVFTWYGALICLAVYAAVTSNYLGRAERAESLVLLVLPGLIGQAVALAASLAFLRKNRGEKRIPVSLCQIIGLGVLFLLGQSGAYSRFFLPELLPAEDSFWWYGVDIDLLAFFGISLLLFLGWAVLAVHRLMRAELQHRTLPWAWAAFALYAMIYLNGYRDFAAASPDAWFARWLGIPFLVAVALVYISFYLDHKSPVAVKALFNALRARQWASAATLTPSWFVCLCLAMLVGAAYAFAAAGAYEVNPLRDLLPNLFMTSQTVVAILLFVLRDIGFLLLLNFAARPKRPDMAGAIYLFVLYAVGGGILAQLDYYPALSIVVPYDSGNPLLTIVPVFLQVFVVYGLLYARWRAVAYPVADRPAVASGQSGPEA
jgi:hypothetical protein